MSNVIRPSLIASMAALSLMLLVIAFVPGVPAQLYTITYVLIGVVLTLGVLTAFEKKYNE